MMSFFGVKKASNNNIDCYMSDDDNGEDSSWESNKGHSVYDKSIVSDASTIFSVVARDNYSNNNAGSTNNPAPSSIVVKKKTKSILMRGGRQGKEDNSSQESLKFTDGIEVNYDTDCTPLFANIQDQNWEAAAASAKADPIQIQTWVYRKEPASPDKLRWRLLPIHAMCVFVAPESLMELLLDNCPQAASMTDDQKMLPIHLACRNGSAKGVVKLLLDAYPEGIHTKDWKGRTPSDIARASSNFNKEGIIMTLDRFRKNLQAQQKQKDGNLPSPSLANGTNQKNGPQEVSYENRTALLKYIIKRDWKSVITRAIQCPKEASVWTKTTGVNGDIRFLPIHKACVLNPPSEVVEALIAAHPAGTKATDQDGWLPLHCAVYYRADDSILCFLIRKKLDACRVKDAEGRLPLHHACMKRSSCMVVQKLIDAYPKSLKVKDDNGVTALHLACGHGCSPEVLEILVSEFPKSAQSRDDQGRLPLHHLCCNSDTKEDDAESMTRILLNTFKSGVTIQDDQGKLPMHYACENSNIGDVALSLLFSAFPNAVEVKDGYGYTPITAAQAFGNDMDALLSTLSGEAKGREENCKGLQFSPQSNPIPRKQRNGPSPFFSPGESPNRSPLRQHLDDSVKENKATAVEKLQDCKQIVTCPEKNNNDAVETEIVSRLSQLENVLATFGQAMKSMQRKLEEDEDPKEFLNNVSLESNKVRPNPKAE